MMLLRQVGAVVQVVLRLWLHDQAALLGHERVLTRGDSMRRISIILHLLAENYILPLRSHHFVLILLDERH